MEIFTPLTNFIINKFDVIFSGAGVPFLLAIVMTIGIIALWISSRIKALFSKCIKKITQQTPTPAPVIPTPSRQKNPLTKPMFKIKCISYGGTLGISQFAAFELTNRGGKAFNVELSGECLDSARDLGDIGRQQHKNFRVDLDPTEHWATISFQIRYLDKDGDEGKQGLWLRYETGSRGYVQQ